MRLKITPQSKQAIFQRLDDIQGATEGLQDLLDEVEDSLGDEDEQTWDEVQNWKDDAGDIGILRGRIAKALERFA